MKLQDLLKNIQPVEIAGDVETEVTGVNIDSRKIKDSHLFVAMKGTQVDGHKFIPKPSSLAPNPFCAKTCLRRRWKASPT